MPLDPDPEPWVLSPAAVTPRYRMKLRHTRRIIDAIHNGELGRAQYSTTPIFNLHIPKTVTDVPDDILTPEQQWSDRAAFSKVGPLNATLVYNIGPAEQEEPRGRFGPAAF